MRKLSQHTKANRLARAEGFIATRKRYDWMGETGCILEWKLHNSRHDVIREGRPDYFGDLRAMRVIRGRVLKTEELQTRFISELGHAIVPLNKGYDECIYELLDASAAQQAEALGVVLDLWRRGE